MRIVFMGTPQFAVPSLEALIENGYEVVGVITQPDRPVGRGKKIEETPVKICAKAHGIPVYQFERLRRKEGRECLESLAPDLCVTAAFGQILSQRLLDIPKMGTVNVHASLLPQYRGSAPINWCIYYGEKTAGVTTMMTDAGIDTGDMLLRSETEILPNETAGELTERLSHIGAQLLIKTLKAMEAGNCPRVKQDEALASHQPMMEKEMARVDWNKSAQEICNAVRAFNPWPGAFTALGEGVMKIWMAQPEQTDMQGKPGEVLVSSAKQGLVVACSEGAVRIIEMQAPNAKRMQAKAYLAGKSIPEGTILGGGNE